MNLKIAIPKETAPHEKRVAATPDTVKKYIALGATVMIESGAGAASAITDEAYKNAGGIISKGKDDLYKSADIVLRVQKPDDKELAAIPKGALLVAMLAPYSDEATIKAYAKAGIDAFSMELVPRISRAQSMDVLSSQSNLAGYKSVLDACEHYPHAFPMMMTAAGTVPPAKVFVMGAGVAGLQAIATAKRLGAVVTATDVRPAAKEQVQSLGGNFIAVEDEEFKAAETAGGYAKEMSKEYQKKQAELVEAHIAKQDIVITTALIPGRPAPKLVTEAMVKSMKPGSVIVDLAVETGGNCALSKAGSVEVVNGVSIIGHINVPSRLAADASSLYAKNLLNLLTLIINKESKKLEIKWDDDIIKGVALTKSGDVIHPNFGGKKPAEKKEGNKDAPKEALKEDHSADKAEEKPQAKAPAKKTATKKKAAPKKKAPAKKSAANDTSDKGEKA
ncbi:MAG: Re/Si-specific NAD(P)(+) transhydrogenase subunit alpha [Micavibrio sp.]|nr:Re/Si-specific NAD(P)(+) transhydrogenase subunit alpha [Micavibrio sp.]